MPKPTNWTKQSVNSTAWTKQSVNPTPWTPGEVVVPTGTLLLDDGVSFLELSDGNFLGLLGT